MKTNRSWQEFLEKIRKEWLKLTDNTYFETEDLKKSCKEISDDIIERNILNRIELLKCINKEVIKISKMEMDHHLEQHNLYKQIIEDYER